MLSWLVAYWNDVLTFCKIPLPTPLTKPNPVFTVPSSLVVLAVIPSLEVKLPSTLFLTVPRVLPIAEPLAKIYCAPLAMLENRPNILLPNPIGILIRVPIAFANLPLNSLLYIFLAIHLNGDVIATNTLCINPLTFLPKRPIAENSG